MAFLGIKTPCLIPCLPPFSFGCRDENGELPCQVAYYENKASKRKSTSQDKVTNAEKRLGLETIKTTGRVQDAATTGSSNYSTGAENLGSAGALAGEVTTALIGSLTMSGAFDAIFGGEEDDDDGSSDAPNKGPGGFELTNTAIVFGGMGIALLLLTMRSR